MGIYYKDNDGPINFTTFFYAQGDLFNSKIPIFKDQ